MQSHPAIGLQISIPAIIQCIFKAAGSWPSAALQLLWKNNFLQKYLQIIFAIFCHFAVPRQTKIPLLNLTSAQWVQKPIQIRSDIFGWPARKHLHFGWLARKYLDGYLHPVICSSCENTEELLPYLGFHLRQILHTQDLVCHIGWHHPHTYTFLQICVPWFNFWCSLAKKFTTFMGHKTAEEKDWKPSPGSSQFIPQTQIYLGKLPSNLL